MRGVENRDARDPFPRQPCTCDMSEEGEHSKDCPGHWLRTLSEWRGVGGEHSADCPGHWLRPLSEWRGGRRLRAEACLSTPFSSNHGCQPDIPHILPRL